ncbi:MAG: 30S ribosomal protein S12 methylthiotransferase RimO [Bacteroidales bacterium]
MKIQKKINFITLGCSKNVVDSEKLMAQFEHGGYSTLHNGELDSAKIVIINTCGFINDAKEESINTILEYAQAKKRGEIEKLFVFGCLSERYKKDLRKEIPEVDSYFGVNNWAEILQSLGVQNMKKLIGERILSTTQHYAYLKIAEGCNWTCSYCAIPLIRGKYHSTPIEELVQEAHLLARQGVKELILIAQDLTYYGLDIYKTRRLADLLKKLIEIDEIKWIRLHYAHPSLFPLDILEVMQQSEKVCPYIDIPFQHINSEVLEKMQRHTSKEEIYDLIRTIRHKIPNITLRTTLMVGHPGETKEAFDELLDFVRTVKFERLGVFTYSEETGTYGAKNNPDTISLEEKQHRADIVMTLQSSISTSLNEQKIGKVMEVVIDRKEREYYIGRTKNDSPEVDGEILIESKQHLEVGNFYSAKITNSNEFDLFGSIIP